jgi:hypothetical protein
MTVLLTIVNVLILRNFELKKAQTQIENCFAVSKYLRPICFEAVANWTLGRQPSREKCVRMKKQISNYLMVWVRYFYYLCIFTCLSFFFFPFVFCSLPSDFTALTLKSVAQKRGEIALLLQRTRWRFIRGNLGKYCTEIIQMLGLWKKASIKCVACMNLTAFQLLLCSYVRLAKTLVKQNITRVSYKIGLIRLAKVQICKVGER